MGTLLSQTVGLVLLIAGLGLGYRRWIKPYQKLVNRQGQGLLLLIVLTMMGGFIGSPFWWFDFPQSFSWDLPPLASRMLASAGWSFVVVCFLVLRRPTFGRVRLVLILLFVYLAPLTAAILLFHLDRFDPTAPITYAFFGIVILIVTTTTLYLLRQPKIIPEDARDQTVSGRLMQTWLGAVAVLCGLWGVALFVTDRGPYSSIWVWSGDLLSSRLIGVMLLTIAVGAIASLRRADLSRLMLSTIVTYGAGLTVASLWNIVGSKPIPMVYFSIFGTVALVSTGLLVFGPPHKAGGTERST